MSPDPSAEQVRGIPYSYKTGKNREKLLALLEGFSISVELGYTALTSTPLRVASLTIDPQKQQYHIFLLGPLRVIAPDGSDVTPSGAKAQGLVALLAMPPGKSWSRSALQDKLWSDRTPQNGRDSLKKEISKVRKLFAGDESDALIVAGQVLRLDETAVRVDVYDPDLRAEHRGPLLPELLEGCDVRDPQFEAWLRECRSSLHHLSERATPTACLDKPSVSREPRLKIAILPAIAAQGPIDVSMLADMIIDRLAIALRQLDIFDIIDFREKPGAEMGRGADVTLRLKAMMLGDELFLSIMAHQSGCQRLLWADRRLLRVAGFGTEEVSSVVANFLDRLLSALLELTRSSDAEQRAATRFALDAIDLMFRLEKPSIEGASRALRRAIDISPRSPYLALFAFNNVFRLEASKGRDMAALREHTDELVARALETDPFNPFARSLITHVYSFMFRDFEAAERMIAPLGSSPPDTPFYFHSLAALRLYTGRLSEARRAAEQCKAMSQFSPYHYAFATTVAAVNTVDNRIEDAIRQGEEVVAMHHGAERIYEPALRYLAAAYGLKGDAANGRRVTAMIKRQSPDFSIQSLKERNYPVPSELSREAIRTGLIRANGTRS
jgi:DNA-binding SARP family transcriptional activator